MIRKVTKDYKELSFNELHELITSLYQEVDRLTAERDAASAALGSLKHNVSLGYSEKEVIRKTVLEAISESKGKRAAKKRK